MRPRITISDPTATVQVTSGGASVVVNGTPSVITMAAHGVQGPQGESGLDFAITVADTQPSSPSVGDVWIQTT